MNYSVHFVDEYVGQRLRMKRVLAGLTQEMLADQIGVTFQQVQKYERGGNRISASRLYDVSLVLKEPVSFFFEELPGQSESKLGSVRADVNGSNNQAMAAFELKRETLELVRAFYSISDVKLRKHVKELLKALAHGKAIV